MQTVPLGEPPSDCAKTDVGTSRHRATSVARGDKQRPLLCGAEVELRFRDANIGNIRRRMTVGRSRCVATVESAISVTCEALIYQSNILTGFLSSH